MVNESGTAVLAALIAYKLLLIVVGLWAKGRTQDTDSFYLGGRNLPPFVAALSASASSSSAWTLMGVSGAAYSWGLSAIWLFPACVGGFLINWYLIAPAIQRISHATGALTVTELILGPAQGAERKRIAGLASFIILISLVTYIASQFQGAGKALHETFDWSAETSIIIGSIVVIFYTLLGGFWAVSLTDTLQGLVMLFTAIVLPLAAVATLGGPTAFVTRLFEHSDPNFLSLTGAWPSAATAGFILGLLGIGLGYPGQPHVVNRFMALQNHPRAIILARRYSITWAVLVYAGMLCLGFAGRILVPELSDQEVVFVALTHMLFPPVVAGIMLAAVLSAIMSTADSQLLVAASSITHDIGYKPIQNSVHLSRWVIVILSGIATLAALFSPSAIFGRVLFAWSAMGSAFGPLVFARSLGWRVSPNATLIAMTLGFGLSVFAYSFETTRGTAFERILPWLLALGVAWWGTLPREK